MLTKICKKQFSFSVTKKLGCEFFLTHFIIAKSTVIWISSKCIKQNMLKTLCQMNDLCKTVHDVNCCQQPPINKGKSTDSKFLLSLYIDSCSISFKTLPEKSAKDSHSHPITVVRANKDIQVSELRATKKLKCTPNYRHFQRKNILLEKFSCRVENSVKILFFCLKNSVNSSQDKIKIWF